MSRKQLTGGVLFATITALAVSGGYLEWHPDAGASAKAAVAMQQVVVPVTVQTLNPQKLRVWSEFSGRLNAVDYAEIRPEVSGRITEVRFKDGQTVHAGDV